MLLHIIIRDRSKRYFLTQYCKFSMTGSSCSQLYVSRCLTLDTRVYGDQLYTPASGFWYLCSLSQWKLYSIPFQNILRLTRYNLLKRIGNWAWHEFWEIIKVTFQSIILHQFFLFSDFVSKMICILHVNFNFHHINKNGLFILDLVKVNLSALSRVLPS